MQFQSPEWFFLIPALVLLTWVWKPLRLWRPLRLLCLLSLTLLLTKPTFDRQQDMLDLWVLLDRSESTEDLVDKGLPEWRRLLESSKPSKNDRLRLVDYGAEVLEKGIGETSVYSGSRKLTRTKLALDTVLALAPEDRPSRVLLFTDGYSTEPLQDTAARLIAQGIPLDFRLVCEEIANDFRIARIEMPGRAQIAQPFVIGITVHGHTDTTIPLSIYRGETLLINTEVSLKNGLGKVEFSDRLPQSGSYNYKVRITPEEDAYPGNNNSERWIEITGGPRLLLVSKYTNDPLAESLRTQGFTVDIVNSPESLKVGQLSGARACILNNVAAFEIPTDFLESLNFFVREQGGGLLMAGGKRSFGSGGYFNSAIDELLPVSMELKTEHRKLSVALAIVLDRSGSMGMNVGGGGLTKMDLANEGSANAINLLGSMDQVTVFAVDSEPHLIVPLTDVRNGKPALINRVKKIRSEGGGIYVFNGLEAAWKELQNAKSGTKHIILFSDAADSEQPGAYKKLLKEITSNNGSVSVIGLGSQADSDAWLLKDVASLGNGRIFFTDRPAEIPKIFAQETVTIARSAFVDEPVETQPSGRWSEISPTPLAWLSKIDGYNLSYTREDATASLVSKDEYVAPLVAHARRGIGRTAAVSFPLGGEFSELTRTWPKYGDFTQTLGRWLMGSELPPGIGLRHRIEGTQLILNLFYDTQEWGQKLSTHPPLIKIVEGDARNTPYELSWKRISPGHFSITHDLQEGSTVRGAVQVGSHALSFGPLVVGSATEWAFESARISELRSVSSLSNGRELLDISKAWLRPPVTRQADLTIPLALIALVLFLFDALTTRLGWSLPHVKLPSGISVAAKVKAPKKQATKETKPAPLQEPPTPQKEVPRESRQSRFARAKKRK